MKKHTERHPTASRKNSLGYPGSSSLRAFSYFICAITIFFAFLPHAISAQQLTVLSEPLPLQLQSALPPGINLDRGTPILRTAEHSGGNLILIPSLEASSTIVDLITSSSDASNLVIEALIFLPSSPTAVTFDMKAYLQKLGFIFNKFSSLQGIQYWSGSRNIMRTFYTAAYRVDNPKDQKKIQDPATVNEFLSLPAKPVYIYQKDQTFDGLVTEVQSFFSSTTFLMTNVNATPLRLIGIPVLPPGGLKTGFLAAPSPQGMLLYFVTSIKPPVIGKDRVFESSSNKALALLHWFIAVASSENLIAPATLPWNIDLLPSEIRLVKAGQ